MNAAPGEGDYAVLFTMADRECCSGNTGIEPYSTLAQRDTAFFDIREVFDANGSIKDLSANRTQHLPAIAGMEVFEEFSGTEGQRQKIDKLKLTDRLDALKLFGKATGFLNVKEQPGSPLEAFGADVLLAMREGLQHRLAAWKALNGHAE